jgi:endo-1,4-beta-xylanase
MCILFFLGSAFLDGSALPEAAAAPLKTGNGKFLGNIIAHQAAPPSDFTECWNQVTPENSGKWGWVEQNRDVMNWKWLDSIYLFAKRNNLLFKEHTFIWGFQEPQWMKDLSADEQRAEVEEWIKAFGERYPDDVDFIDVVNEPLNRPVSFREALGGSGTTGWDWVVWAFEKARQYCPKSKLLINEYNIENFSDYADRYVQIITLLKNKGLIDGIGVQSHYFSLQGTSPDTIRANLDKFARTGLPIYSTELDMIGANEDQFQAYQTYFPIFWNHSAVVGITLWGWLEGKTWADSSFLIRKDGTRRPSFTWLQEYVRTQTGVADPAFKTPPPQPASSFRILDARPGGVRLKVDKPGFLTVRVVDQRGRNVIAYPRVFFSAGKHLIPPQRGLAPGVYRVIVTAGSGRKDSSTGRIIVSDFRDVEN